MIHLNILPRRPATKYEINGFRSELFL